MSNQEFLSWPNVMNGDEAPFVLGFAADPRPFKEVQGVRFRRGDESYRVDVPCGGIWLRLCGGLADNGHCVIWASTGPLLNEWWPLLQRAGSDPTRPVLSAGATNQPVTMRGAAGTPLQVSILGPSEWLPGVAAVTSIGAGFSDDTLLVGDLVMLGVVKAALLAFCEYRTLVQEVPAANLETEAGAIELAAMLEIAQEVADVIDWSLVR